MTQRILAALLLMLTTASVVAAQQQPPMTELPPVKDPKGVPAGAFFEPAVLVSERYDDNLFLSPDVRDEDFFLRVTPGLQTGYRSSRVMLTGTANFDAERYNQHRQLDSVFARTNVGVDLSALPSQRVTVRATGSFIDTTTPSELNVLSGIVLGRAEARRFEARPSVSVRLSPRGTLTTGYVGSYDQIEGLTSALTQEGSAEYRFDTSARTFITTHYLVRSFDFEGDHQRPSHAFGVGIGRALSPNTVLSVRGGPRISYSTLVPVSPAVPVPDAPALVEPIERRSIDPEYAIALKHQGRRSEVELAVARTQTTAIGQDVVIDTTSATASFSYRPASRVELRATPGFYHDEIPGLSARVFRVALEFTFWLSNYVAIVSDYGGSYQDGNRELDRLSSPVPTIRQNVVSIGLRASARRRTPPREPGVQIPQGQ